MPELPNIVRDRLKVSRPTADHPDADALTAFAERALPESERAVVAEHLARCHDCRDVLALSVPATVILEPVRVPLPARSGWLRAPVLRWGVVAAGFAVLALTGFLQYQRGRVTPTFIAARQAKTVTGEGTSAQANYGGDLAKPAPGAANALAGSANAAPVSTNRVEGDSVHGSNLETGSVNERSIAATMRDEAAVPSGSLPLNGRNLAPGLPLHGSAAGRTTLGSAIGGPMKQSGQLYGSAASSSAGGAETQSQLVAANTADQAASQPFQYQGKDLKKREGQAPGVGGRAFMDVTVDKAKAPETTTVEVTSEATVLETSSAAPASPSIPSASWGISATGGLLRSFDQGRTWASVDVNASFPVASEMVMVVPQSEKYQQATQDTSLQAKNQAQAQNQAQKQAEAKALRKSRAATQQASAAAVSIPVFRAVSAAGSEVWAGGSAGVLYHSANGGEQWTRVVPLASGTLMTGDITGIAFSDAQHGHITTSTQELWTTFDAGESWKKQ